MEDKLTKKEEELRALTENFSLDIDTSELWNNIEARLPNTERRRRPIAWWFVTGALVAIIGLLLWSNDSKAIENTENTEKTTDTIDGNEHVLHTDQTKEHTKNTPLAKSERDLESVNATMSSSLLEKSIANPKNGKTKNIQEQNTLINNYHRYDDKPTSRKVEAIDQTTVVEHKPIVALVNPSNSMDEKINSEENHLNRQLLTHIHANILKPSLFEHINEFDKDKLQRAIEPLKSSKWMPYFAFASGVNFHRSSIYANSNESLSLDQFKSEKPLPSFSSFLRFGYENNSGWRLGLGLAHTKLVNRIHQKAAISTTKEINGIESLKIDDDGNILMTEGIVTETIVTNYDYKWHRNHDFVNIQLSAGKRLLQQGRLTLYSDAVVSKNIWARHSGYYLTENNELITRFEAGEENPYSNAGYELGLSLALEYRLNQLSISISPFATLGLNSIMQKTNYYQLKNSQYGVQLGVVYRP